MENIHTYSVAYAIIIIIIIQVIIFRRLRLVEHLAKTLNRRIWFDVLWPAGIFVGDSGKYSHV